MIRSEGGFTLAELAMYGLLLSIVVAVGAGIIISGTAAEKTVRTVIGASTQGQLAADSIETGVRNSSGYSVTVPTSGTQLLSARVAQGGSGSVQWTCAAWFYSPFTNNGSIWYKASPTAITVNSGTDFSSWVLLVNNVRPSTGNDIFSVGGDQVVFSFKTLAGTTDPPAKIASSASSRSEIWETAPCF
jgi:hypothetical protein